MANRKWYFDGKEVIGTDGAALRWDDHQFFTLTFKGQRFFGELLENNTESNALTVKINHRVFQIKKKVKINYNY